MVTLAFKSKCIRSSDQRHPGTTSEEVLLSSASSVQTQTLPGKPKRALLRSSRTGARELPRGDPPQNPRKIQGRAGDLKFASETRYSQSRFDSTLNRGYALSHWARHYRGSPWPSGLSVDQVG